MWSKNPLVNIPTNPNTTRSPKDNLFPATNPLEPLLTMSASMYVKYLGITVATNSSLAFFYSSPYNIKEG